MPALAELVRDLVNIAAPISFEIGEDNANEVTIKGFASVEVVDRSGDIVPPEEFNIKQFMASPTILVNHKFWMDENGNEISVGKAESLHVVELVAQEDSEVWSIKDVETNEIIDTFPREKVPNLGAGDRGLFIVAKVTEPSVVAKVRRGELSAFSWRGLASVDFRVNKSNDLERVLTDIDLFEISLVDIPDNPNSSFIRAKSAHMIKLAKSIFDTPQKAGKYLSNHNLAYNNVIQDDNYYYSRQLDAECFDLEKLVVMKMENGVEVIAGELTPTTQQQLVKSEKEESKTWPWAWLSKESIERFKQGAIDCTVQGKSSEESEMSEEKVPEAEVKDEEVKNEEEKKTEESKETQEDTNTEKNVAAMVEFQEAIAAKTAEALTPLFEGLTASNQAIVDILTKAFEKAESSKDEEKAEETKSVEVWDKLNTMAEVLTGMQNQLVEVAKSAQEAEEKAASLAESTPDETERDEKVDTQKKASSDPNAVFDSVFAFLKG